ncbi:MAG: UDP-N-acetylmuramoyl-L-alanyl-D-glutamate--2,6-diaminopimelate ligase [Janthinobacterium lividum]
MNVPRDRRNGADLSPGLEVATAWLNATLKAGADLHADSREVAPGDGFLAYAVEGADNRPHIGAALARGAAAVVWQPEHADLAVLRAVEGAAAHHALPQLDMLAGPLASAWYGAPSEAMQVIGITGTNGKTSCSHWVAQALSAAGTPCAIVGTLGVGLPGQLTVTGFTTPDAPRLQRALARLRADGAQAVAMEVSSHALHQGRSNGVAFDVAVFTNLTQDHLDYHHTMAAYEAAKARLFETPGLRAAVLNRDDAAGCRLLAQLAADVQPIAYWIDAAPAAPAACADTSSATSAHRAPLPPRTAALFARQIRPTARGTAFMLDGDWGTAHIETAIIGAFNVSNLLAVCGALLAQKMPFDAACAALARLTPVPGRMQRVSSGPRSNEPLVVVDYAHTPDALEKALATLRPVADARGGALHCVFGCGGDRDAGKRPLMGAVAAHGADTVVLTSDNPRSESPMLIIEQIAAGIPAAAHATADSTERVRQVEDRARAILQTIRQAACADVVLVAGKGHETTQEALGVKQPFSDVDHVQLALAARAAQRDGQS